MVVRWIYLDQPNIGTSWTHRHHVYLITVERVSNELKMVVHVAMPRPGDRRGQLSNLLLSVPQYNEEFSKISLCEAGRHPRQGNLLTIPYMHMCSHCNLQVMGFRSSCPAPSADEMDYEKQVRSVHDRDDSSLSNGCIGR